MKTSLACAALLLAIAGPATAAHWQIRWGDAAPRGACDTWRYRHDPIRPAPPSGGYWIVIDQPVRQPGYWAYWPRPCGTYQRRWVPPQTYCVPRRVWVPSCSPARGPRR